MPGNTENQNEDKTGSENTGAGGENKTVPDVDAILAEKVQEALKPIKEKLDSAYAARDAAAAEAKALKEEKQAAEIARLNEEGKHREAYELQLAAEKAAREAAEARVVELTRDTELRSALAGYKTRNANANEMALKELTKDLVRNEKGIWVHKTGLSIPDFVKAFATSEDNAFLFEQKPSTGGGSGQLKKDTGKGRTGSIFDLSQDEVLKRAADGTLRNK